MPLTEEQKARRDKLRDGIKRIAREAFAELEAERIAGNDGNTGRTGTAGNGGPPKRRTGDAAGSTTPSQGTPAQEPATGDRRSLARRAFYGRYGQAAPK